ncbi:MAG: FtsX-like permease family protein, partial [Syntrophomonadaceae bacterium]|nr:FtsX-like permease family protein [Syntrophomonadaceae bacterium]
TTDLLNKTVTLNFKKYSGGNIEQRDYRVKVIGVLKEGEGEWGPAIYLSMDMLNDIKKWLGQETVQIQERANRGETTYESMKVKVSGREQVEKVVEDIRNMGLQTWSPTESLKEMNKFFAVLQLILGGIGAISLLVASIGIMNTMFMSILERTREIGMTKVLGASIYDIRKLFLVESGTIGFIGGIVGLIIGHAVVAIINLVARHNTGMSPFGGQMDKIAVIPLWLSLFALGFAIFIGVLFGYLPANRAAKISPLQAIRHE